MLLTGGCATCAQRGPSGTPPRPLLPRQAPRPRFRDAAPTVLVWREHELRWRVWRMPFRRCRCRSRAPLAAASSPLTRVGPKVRALRRLQQSDEAPSFSSTPAASGCRGAGRVCGRASSPLLQLLCCPATEDDARDRSPRSRQHFRPCAALAPGRAAKLARLLLGGERLRNVVLQASSRRVFNVQQGHATPDTKAAKRSCDEKKNAGRPCSREHSLPGRTCARAEFAVLITLCRPESA